MIASPWNLLLATLFALTGAICSLELLRVGDRRRSTAALVDVGHLLMGIAMIAMIWRTPTALVSWLEGALFAAIALGLLRALRAAGDPDERTDLLSHAVFNLAMVWMLVAMDWLMAGGSHSQHGGAAAANMSESTPAWATVLNVAFIAACLAGAGWWIFRGSTKGCDRLHGLCHLMVGIGMAAMLALMNA